MEKRGGRMEEERDGEEEKRERECMGRGVRVRTVKAFTLFCILMSCTLSTELKVLAREIPGPGGYMKGKFGRG